MKGLEGEIDETIGKIKISIETLVTLRASYDQCKLDMDFKVTVIHMASYFPHILIHLYFLNKLAQEYISESFSEWDAKELGFPIRSCVYKIKCISAALAKH